MGYPETDQKVNIPPALDWKAIRDRALFYVRRRGLPETMVDGIGSGTDGEVKLIQFAADTGESLDYLVTGKRPLWHKWDRATTTISDVRAVIWALDRITFDMSPQAKERANDDHAVRSLVNRAWDLIEEHEKAEYRDADEEAA